MQKYNRKMDEIIDNNNNNCNNNDSNNKNDNMDATITTTICVPTMKSYHHQWASQHQNTKMTKVDHASHDGELILKVPNHQTKDDDIFLLSFNIQSLLLKQDYLHDGHCNIPIPSSNLEDYDIRLLLCDWIIRLRCIYNIQQKQLPNPIRLHKNIYYDDKLLLIFERINQLQSIKFDFNYNNDIIIINNDDGNIQQEK